VATTILKNLKEAKNRKPSQHLYNAINYIMNPEKTENGLWVGSNCGITTHEIYDAMMVTKNEFNKTWGRQGYHFVISFKPGETDERTCYKVGKEFCEKYLGDGYEYVYAVHNDHAHMHCHIVFNSVGRYDGSKYRYVNGDWEKYIQPVTDVITQKYGLSKLEYDKNTERSGRSYAEHKALKADKFTWKSIIRLDIDMAISNSDSIEEYYAEMRRMGYHIRIGQSEKHGEYAAYSHPAMKEVRGRTSKAARRDYILGDNYTVTGIKKRIAGKKITNDYISSDTVYVKEQLHTISEHKNKSRFQACAIVRYQHARQYHYFDMQLKEQIQVRKDLLEIDKIRDECNYILDNDIADVDIAKARLSYVKSQIKELKNTVQDIEVSESIYNEDEIRVRNEYFSLYNMLMSAESNMSDEEYEKISDKLEQYEEDYGEILKTPQNKDNIQYQAEISKLYEEKRILTRIIKNADIYGKVTESVTFEVDKAKDNISQPYIEYTQGNKDVKNI
jgi:hypothetical protein